MILMDGHVLPEKRPAMELWGCKAHRRSGLLYKLSLGSRCLSNVTETAKSQQPQLVIIDYK